MFAYAVHKKYRGFPRKTAMNLTTWKEIQNKKNWRVDT